MKNLFSIACVIAFLLSSYGGSCQFSNIEFVENKGQWDSSVRFKGLVNNGAFFLRANGFRVLQNSAEDLEKMTEYFHGSSHESGGTNTAARSINPPKEKGVTVHAHAYDVRFVNASSPLISADKSLDSYNNYFIGNDPTKWGSNCRVFQAVNYRNIYPGVDVRYYTGDGRLKYDIIVNAGSDLSQVVMKYEGVDGLEVRDEELIIKTSVGEVKELAPYAYQVINGVKATVNCGFKVRGNTVQFVAEHYSTATPLIIDPTLVFATFTGSTVDNWGYTATYGPDESFYAGGIVFGTGFPTSTGSFSTTYNGGAGDEEGIGGYDMGIIKFNKTGTSRIYATYIGGSGNEQPHSLVVDSRGDLVIGGRSASANYPLKGGDTIGPCKKYDIVLTKLNAAGSALIGSRKIGGSERDGVNIRPKYPLSGPLESIRRNYGDDARSEVIIDNSGNIWLASNSQSADFPATANAFQGSLAGKQDGVIIMANADLTNVSLRTFMGGSENDAAFVLAINPLNNNIYVGGNTVSANLPGDKSGVIRSTFQGGETDGFVSVIDFATHSLIKTTYVGTPGNDMLYGIQFDKFGFPYIMGTTTGSWPVINAAFSQTGGKQFISKLMPDLSGFEYSTVFGTNSLAPNISPIAFLVDRCENVYVSGWGGQVDTKGNYPNSGTTGLTTTPDAIQSRTDNSDFYFFVLERNAGRQLYGSFFGQSGGFGEHVDGGTSRFDRNGVIYQALCANCGRDVQFPTTPGVWAPNNGSPSCNLAAVKIAFNLAGVAGSIKSSIVGSTQDTVGCVPLTVNFIDTIGAGKRYVWNFGDGTADIVTTNPALSHTYTSIGNYRVRLTSIDSGKCNVADTAYTTIHVKTFKGTLDFSSTKLQPCDAFNYAFGNNSFVTPNVRSFTSTSFTWDFGDNSAPVIAGKTTINHSFPGPGIYKVRLMLTDTNFCNAPDVIERELRIATNVKAAFNTPFKGCAPYTAVFNNTSSGGQQFFWDFGDKSTSTQVNPTHLYATPGMYLVKLRAIDSATCNLVDTTSFTITISSKPIASFIFSPDPPQENTAVRFNNNSIAASAYIWQFGDGETLHTNSAGFVEHIYNQTRSFQACLIATTVSDCRDTVCQNIVARVNPLLDVPNAFTPNGDGNNDKVFVRGFGIMKMAWKIYNRWGVVVFETNDRTQGWDGTYKGVKQPTEVYHYTLEVEYADDTHYQKRGDITLLR